jgi:hypothetical protein
MKIPKSLLIFDKPVEYETVIVPFEIEIDASERSLLPLWPDDHEGWRKVWKEAEKEGKVFNMTKREYYTNKRRMDTIHLEDTNDQP